MLRMGLQSERSTFGFTFSRLPLGILNLCSLLLFPWTLSILLSPGLIWYTTNWLHQKVIMLHIIIIIIITLLFLPLFTSNLSTRENSFMGFRIVWIVFYVYIIFILSRLRHFKVYDLTICISPLQGKPSSCIPTISLDSLSSWRNPAWLLSSRLIASQIKFCPGEIGCSESCIKQDW